MTPINENEEWTPGEPESVGPNCPICGKPWVPPVVTDEMVERAYQAYWVIRPVQGGEGEEPSSKRAMRAALEAAQKP